ncbi:MAG: RNA degradosome polyphosphate kinase [Acidaminococcales bacterium]|nr:RNA degradosome polyphosphate kinase [Acidaminococcales bacterium]
MPKYAPLSKSKFNMPENFINRELSWLKFNARVLNESTVRELPLLERLRFISIAAANLDEFFMVRVANLIDLLESGYQGRDPAGLTATAQFDKVSAATHKMMKTFYKYLFPLIKELRNHGIIIARTGDLSPEGGEWLRQYFNNTVFPVLTPMAVDASRPFPFLANRSVNLAVTFQENKNDKSEHKHIAFVQVPSVLPRLLEVKTNDSGRVFVFLEELIMQYCQALFPGHKIKTVLPFRITRNADLYIDDIDTDDLLKEVERSLRKRSRGDVVRLEVNAADDDEIIIFLKKNLSLDKSDIYEINGPLDLTCFFKLANMPDFASLCNAPQPPQTPADLLCCDDILALAKEKDIMLHHPFESFEPLVKLVCNAAEDPEVLAIKQTLYRVSGNSPIVDALARAAENGKQVTVLVELKARFDEENNITWAKRLEKSGCHVIYGLVGLKTHSKIILIVRLENGRIKRYVHLGTGNYNDNTAALYTDMGIITSNEQIGADASAFFNVLSGYSEPPLLDKLAMAPIGLREKFYKLINNEIAIAKNGGTGRIIAKMNSLIDRDMILKLYEASHAGVRIDLIVRGICGLIGGKQNVSENIAVRSIVGRYLEHTRIFYFFNGGEEEVYLSSADWMERNLNDRVELLFPVERGEHIERIKNILDVYLKDNVKAYTMGSNGTYRRFGSRPPQIDAQAELYRSACEYAQSGQPSLQQKMRPLYKKEENNYLEEDRV